MNDINLNNLSEQIVILSTRFYPLAREVFKDFHSDEIAILHNLRANGGELPRCELISKLGIDSKLVSRRVRNLISQGLVVSVRSRKSARESIDKITKKGTAEFENLRNRMKAVLEQGMAFIDKPEQETLNKAVKQLNTKIETLMAMVR